MLNLLLSSIEHLATLSFRFQWNGSDQGNEMCMDEIKVNESHKDYLICMSNRENKYETSID